MKKHGMCGTPEHKAWSEMKQRCHNPRNGKYKWYGARGISVCDEWRDDFMSFFAHIGLKPSKEYELDRMDNDKGYEPGNVHWVTRLGNVRNRSNTIRVIFEGKEVLLEDYAKSVGISYGTAWARMKRHPHLISGEAYISRSGENNPNVKLTDEQVSEIRASKEPTKTLRLRYGVSRTLIQGIRRGDFRRSLESSRRIEAKTV